jgi:nucleoside-diphosphate-sugar epimerase
MKAVIAGVMGLVGRNMADLLVGQGWQVLGISRTAPADAVPFEHVALDLTDGAACRAAAGRFRGVTHVFWCGRAPRPTIAEEARVNADMLFNLMAGVEAGTDALRHVCLVHGTKWYGSHLGPFRTPAREDDPRHMPPNHYFEQQDWVEARAPQAGWTWSALRPHIIVGQQVGYPHSLVNLIGVYGSISAELGLPLGFPGRVPAFSTLSTATDVGLLNRAMLWAATSPAAANQAFNITNGDYFRWCNLWPALARFFGIEDGGVRPIRLAAQMAVKDAVWRRVVDRHGLQPWRLDQIVSWPYGDFLFATTWDAMSSSGKAMRAGFTETIDSEACFLDNLAELRRRRVIP